MIRRRTRVLSLVPFVLVLGGTGYSRFAHGTAVPTAAGDPELREDSSLDTAELDPSEPTMEILRAAVEPAFGAGQCPTGIVIELWPPNHKYVTIDLTQVLGAQTQGIEIVSITQDEPVDDLGDGSTTCDGDGIGTSTLRVRSERSGLLNGRVYEIEYSAFGGACGGFVNVTVPHDRRGAEAVDDGQVHDSTEGCP